MVQKLKKRKIRYVGKVNGKRIKTTERKWEKLIETSKKVAYRQDPEQIIVETLHNPKTRYSFPHTNKRR
jgi:hypothetical protein